MKKYFYLASFALAFSLGFAALADAPLSPANITATSTTQTSVDLSWASSTGAVSYQIFRNSTSTPIATTSNLSYVDTGLAPFTIYNYYLAAVDASSTVSALSSSTEVKTLADTVSPSVPAILLEAPTSTSLTVNPSPIPTSTIAAKILIKNGDKAAKLINVRSNQEVKIVVLGSAELDVENIVHSSVKFAGDKQHERKYKDHDRDGKMDVIYEFRAKKMTELTNGTSTANFIAKTKDNKTVSASLVVNVKNGKPKPVKKAENKIVKLEKEIKKLENKIEQKQEQLKKVEEKMKEVSEKKEDKKKDKKGDDKRNKNKKD